MKRDDESLWLSATDLATRLECAHAITMSLAAELDGGPQGFRGGAYAELLATKGREHERAYYDQLIAEGRQVVEITIEDGFAAAATRTIEAMRRGAEVIYQATFAHDGWRGQADFLERVEAETALGGWGYEAVDTKVARSEALPHHALQLGVYSQEIERIQEAAPAKMHLELGSGKRESIRVRDVAAYVRRARLALERTVKERPATTAYPCSYCAFCSFSRECERGWRESDHLSEVAAIRRDHVQALETAGIDTMAALAGHDPSAHLPGLRDEALATLARQAALQVAARTQDRLLFEPREIPDDDAARDRGFARLPQPDQADVFFDLEGDPFWTPARELIFLLGIVLREGDDWTYEQIWAHTPEQEKRAFERLIDLLIDRLERFPAMHVYHYSPAEPSAIKRLSATFATREDEVDELLRREVFVDLYAIVRQGLVIGAPSYGLKTAERLAGFQRHAEAGSGTDAVLLYEDLCSRADDADRAEIAAKIADYNAEDCHATRVLRDWLIERRPPELEWWTLPPPPEVKPETVEERIARAAVRDQLLERHPDPGAGRLAAHVLDYHRREARPDWWEYFMRRELDAQGLIDNRSSLGGLDPFGAPIAVKRSLLYSLRFPEQPLNIGAGDSVEDPIAARDPELGLPKGYTIEALDPDSLTLTVKRGAKKDHLPLPQGLIASGPLNTKTQRAALLRLARAISDGTDRYPALIDILERAAPKVSGVERGGAIQTRDLDQQKALARGLAQSYLFIQGPPGTGKTWLGGQIAADLLAQGKRVAISAVSHKAINGLLGEIEDAADEIGCEFRGARKTSDHPDSHLEGSERIENLSKTADCLDGDFDLVAGTSWLLAREDFDRHFDYLIIDEAGQMSLADALAIGTCARNLILIGDPLQLPQVVKGTHPEGSGQSVMEHLLDGAPTISRDRGLFLEITRRMHPDVCRFISDEVYDGRLEPLDECERQVTDLGTGLRFMPVEHSANSTSSAEEAAAISLMLDELLGIEITDLSGGARRLTPADVMVVAPYNAQVRLLKRRLGPEVAVGTVNAFQGQEAPVVFFSMATSTGDDMPRDAGFLFSRERLNVAISRARSLAYLVLNPALLEAPARDLEQMKLISTLCAAVEYAEPRAVSP